MTKEKKQEFTMRMTQANRTELLVTIYDLFLEYMKDAKEAHEEGDMEAFRNAVNNAQPVITELVSTLDYQYELSYQLLEIYRYCNRCMAAALRDGNPAELAGAALSITNIRKAYYQLSLEDHSPALMRNSQKVYAGLTYGRGELTETMSVGSSRGYLA